MTSEVTTRETRVKWQRRQRRTVYLLHGCRRQWMIYRHRYIEQLEYPLINMRGLACNQQKALIWHRRLVFLLRKGRAPDRGQRRRRELKEVMDCSMRI
ncbi:hypothetical protein FGO68_gene2907 [Halteria grandinella]|uniref:Uncharacterized protein n=1 Tax=Halteria grandinella TaxID=5974 RepID=A0A8J8NEZ9_HALGN|nr:hypothetical protein FGO68_gene2907 [Halteria grandinella]